jgi:hypothetical protein
MEVTTSHDRGRVADSLAAFNSTYCSSGFLLDRTYEPFVPNYNIVEYLTDQSAITRITGHLKIPGIALEFLVRDRGNGKRGYGSE